MKKVILRCTAALVLAGFAASVSGCVPERYSENTAKAVIEQGRPYIEAYMETLPDTCSLEALHMHDGIPDGSPVYGPHYESHVVSARIREGNHAYYAYVDLETEKIYSTYYAFDPNEMIAEQLRPYCERYGYEGEYEVSKAAFATTLISHDIKAGGKTLDVYCSFDKAIPVEYNQSDEHARQSAALQGASIDGFTVTWTLSDDTCFDPRILIDYLKESGNYKNVHTREDYNLYIIEARRPTGTEISGEPQYSYVEMEYEGDIDAMPYYERRVDYLEVENFCYLYDAYIASGNLEDGIEGSEYPCPLRLEGSTLRYTADSEDYGRDAGVFFKEDPGYTEITRIRWAWENLAKSQTTNDRIDQWELVEQEPEEMEVCLDESSGRYYLHLKGDKYKARFGPDPCEVTFR